MANFTFKPSDFYRKQRPGNFSDSYEKNENILTPELLDFELSKITTNQKHDMFEDLCIEMAGNLICPNLIPQTWPTGWGDWKTDSETYPVSDDISIKWYIPENWWEKDQKWAFAVSAKKNWKPKVNEDVKKIIETGRWYTHIYFFTNQTPSSKQKSDVQDKLKDDYWINVTIFDGKWISKNIFSNNLVNLVVKKLNLSDSYKIKQVLWKNDTERRKKLEELEEKIIHPDRYIDFDYQIVIDSINAANISRSLELPKSEIIWKYERAKRFNEKFWSIKLNIQISYQIAWTYYMYFDDYKSFIIEYLNFSELLKDYHDIDSLELYATLIQLLKTLSKQVNLSELAVNMIEIEETYFEALEYFLNDKEKNTNHFIVKAYKIMYYITQAIFEKEDVSSYLKDLKNIINESKSLVKFPFNMFKEQIEVLWQILVDSKEYDDLILFIAEIDSERNSEISSGKIMLERWMQKIKWNSFKDGVIFLWKSVRKLAKEESKYELYYAFLSLSIWYKWLGLNWAHYNSLLSALNIKIQLFFQWDTINDSIITLLEEIIKFEIIAWRLPSVFTWYELYLILSSQTDCITKEERFNYIQKTDMFISVMLSNIDFNNLVNATKLPSILNELWLEISKDTVSYILQGKDGLDEETIKCIWGDSELENFFTLIMNQPLKNQFISEVNLFHKQDLYQFQSKVLWTTIKLYFENNVLYVESFISFIEWFLATSFDIFPTVNSITINLNFSDKKDSQNVDYKLNYHEYTINFNSNFSNINESFFYTLVFILWHSFAWVSKEKMEKLFSSDEVFERVSLITNHNNIFINTIWGESKFQLEKWEKSSYKDIKVLNTKSPLNLINIKKDLDIDDSKERHDNRKIQSIINLPLWNKANWNSFACVATRDPKKELWLVIFFTDKNIWRKIAEEIRLEVWENDKNEIIRLSIIKWINPENKYHYTVHICNNIEKDKRKWWLLINISRYHTMTPDNDSNIKTIEWLYKILWKYTLYFWYADITTGENGIFWDLWIEKRKLNIKDAKDIWENDLEKIVLK